MPIVKLLTLPGKTKLGIWHIEEAADILEKKLQLNESEKALLHSFRHNKRYVHWLGSRVLLRTILQTDQFIELRENEEHKPYLANFPHKVSISHSGDYAAVMLSEEYETGVDIEKISDKALRIAPRFLHPDELEWLLTGADEEKEERAIRLWCAKEALYKLYARGKVDFRKELCIPPGPSIDGPRFKGRILKDGKNEAYPIGILREENYVIAFTYGHRPA